MIKARFQLTSVKEYQGNGANGVEVELDAIYYPPNSEHRSFTDYTPTGNLRMLVANPDVVKILKKHLEFEVTFEPINKDSQ